ncbi:hypothetical protein ACFQZ4_49835 [Catellatospora coxensis]
MGEDPGSRRRAGDRRGRRVLHRCGESLVNRGADALTASSEPPRDAFTVALSSDVGDAPDQLALRRAESDGPVAARLKSGRIDQAWGDFLVQQDGAPVKEVVVKLLLTGHRSNGISITGIDVVKLKSEPVLDGTLVSIISQGQADTIKLSADLDQAQPKIMSGKTEYFTDHRITLKTGEQEGINFTVTGSKEVLHRWVLGIDYVDDNGAAQRLFLDRIGRRYQDASAVPADGWFSLTGPAAKYGVEWPVSVK